MFGENKKRIFDTLEKKTKKKVVILCPERCIWINVEISVNEADCQTYKAKLLIDGFAF